MTPEEQVKYAFLGACADAGLTREETLSVVKEANSKLEKGAFLGDAIKALSGAVSSGTSAVKNVLGAGLKPVPWVIGGGAGMGALGGYMGAKALEDFPAVGNAQTPEQQDLETAKRRELLAQYRQAIAQMRRRELAGQPGL